MLLDDPLPTQPDTEPVTVEVPAPMVNGSVPAEKPVKQRRKARTKATGKAKAKKASARKAKAKPRQRDPNKVDQFGLRKGSIKSKAAAIYSRGRGATLAEVRDAVGSTQFNVLNELQERGFKIQKSSAKGEHRAVTRYKLIPKK